MDSLDSLLRRARAADRTTRIDFRDPIAAFGAQAVGRLAPWLSDPSLGAFAVRTIERAATVSNAAAQARQVLSAALPSSVEPVRGDIVAALLRLGQQTHTRSSLRGGPPPAGLARTSPKSRHEVVPLPGASLAFAYRTLEGLVAQWRSEGEPPQRGIEWPRPDWLAAFPEHADLISRLPRPLARGAVRDVCANATRDEVAAEHAFLSVMVWGFGNVGYGRHRAGEILRGTPRSNERLLAVARTLTARGVIAAYRQLGDEGDSRLKGLGPAFGTKYLYFCQPAGAKPTALIHDSNVADWFTRYAGLDLACDIWSESTYGDYLDQMHAWSTELRCRPDDVELRIFEATVGGQWAKP